MLSRRRVLDTLRFAPVPDEAEAVSAGAGVEGRPPPAGASSAAAAATGVPNAYAIARSEGGAAVGAGAGAGAGAEIRNAAVDRAASRLGLGATRNKLHVSAGAGASGARHASRRGSGLGAVGHGPASPAQPGSGAAAAAAAAGATGDAHDISARSGSFVSNGSSDGLDRYPHRTDGPRRGLWADGGAGGSGGGEEGDGTFPMEDAGGGAEGGDDAPRRVRFAVRAAPPHSVDGMLCSHSFCHLRRTVQMRSVTDRCNLRIAQRADYQPSATPPRAATPAPAGALDHPPSRALRPCRRAAAAPAGRCNDHPRGACAAHRSRLRPRHARRAPLPPHRKVILQSA